jgi:hypothetical protein
MVDTCKHLEIGGGSVRSLIKPFACFRN